jgi:hypothetical protein
MTQASKSVTSHETVEPSPRGAEMLAASYWREVETTTRRLVRADAVDGHVEIRLLGRGPALIRLGPPVVLTDRACVTCTYPIVGGLLVGRPGGTLALEQLNNDPVVLRTTLTEYVPSLAGTLYFQIQARLHSLISRRYFVRLGRGAQ